MTDDIADSPVVTTVRCPGCESGPEDDTGLRETRYCAEHVPNSAGSEDDRVKLEGGLSGSGEAGGAPNRAACDLIHRGGE